MEAAAPRAEVGGRAGAWHGTVTARGLLTRDRIDMVDPARVWCHAAVNSTALTTLDIGVPI